MYDELEQDAFFMQDEDDEEVEGTDEGGSDDLEDDTDEDGDDDDFDPLEEDK